MNATAKADVAKAFNVCQGDLDVEGAMEVLIGLVQKYLFVAAELDYPTPSNFRCGCLFRCCLLVSRDIFH